MTFLSEHDLIASSFTPVSGLKNPKVVIGLSPFNKSMTAIIKFLVSLILLSILSCWMHESYSIFVTFNFNSSIQELFLYKIIVNCWLENLEI